MKLIKTSLVFAVAALMVACGGNKEQKDEKASAEQVADSTDSRKVEAGTYVNEKYGFTIKYPAANFTLKEGLENENGAVFVSEDGKAELKIHLGNLDGSITNVDDFRKAYDTDVANKGKGKRDVTYNAFNVNSYTIMGYEVKTVFYQKTAFTRGVIVTAVLSYDDAVKDTYYPMIEPIFNSFK